MIVAALIAIGTWQRYSQLKRASWPSARVSLPEFRTIPVLVLEGERGSHVIYQAQAHVSYSVEGKQYNVWLPVLSRSDNQKLLELELNVLRNASCYVHWNQTQPKDAFLSCEKSSWNGN